MSILEARDLVFSYADGAPLIVGLDLAVKTGELTVVIGGNASGKTTLLKLLAGLAVPQRGETTIDGVPVREVRDRVGIVFQNPDHQMIAATVREEIALGMELRGIAPALIEGKVYELAKRFAIRDLLHASPETLSGGQKQRVALAAIMVTEPDFLLFDEPDSFLDAPSRRDLLTAVARVRGDCGIVWTTPDLRHIPDADRVRLLEDGRLRSFSGGETVLASRYRLNPVMACNSSRET